MRILISGAGIAGPCLAYWLHRYGFTPTLIEKSPALRTGGYIIDFWGAGFDIAERMGLLPEITRKGYVVQELRVVNSNNQKVAGFPASVFSRATNGRYSSLPRGDLAAAIFGKIENEIETIFGNSVKSLEQTEQGVRIAFETGPERDFDLVIGADGLHSKIRELVFGPEKQFEKYLGYQVAAFEAAGYRPRDELVYVMYTQVGQQVARFAISQDRTMFLLTFAAEAPKNGGIQAQKTFLRERFGRSGWECAQILDALDSTNDLYFDRVSQIRMDSRQGLWKRGRVALVGDAASCVSLLAGQGSALAMIAAYILAGELYRAKGDHAAAFARYEQLFGPFVSNKQKAALRFAGTFAPKSKMSLFLRNRVINLMKIGWVADLAVRRDLMDKIVLPEY